MAALVNQQVARFLTFDVNHFTAMRRTTCTPSLGPIVSFITRYLDPCGETPFVLHI